jgi:hypothetical protein
MEESDGAAGCGLIIFCILLVGLLAFAASFGWHMGG